MRDYGVQAGVITTAPVPAPTSRALSFARLAVSFSTRTVGLVSTESGGRRRTLVQVPRDRDERLESSARKIVSELKRMAERRY